MPRSFQKMIRLTATWPSLNTELLEIKLLVSMTFVFCNFAITASPLAHDQSWILIPGPGIQPNQTPPKDVHIILFYPESEDEGVHTIEFPKGSGNNVILGFEDLKECMEFSRLLEQEEKNLFVEPEPRQIHLKSLEAYCATTLGGDVQVQVVPRGTHLVPPSGTVEELSHTPKQYEEHHQQTTELERIFDLDLVDDKYDDSFDSVGAWE